MNTNAAIVLSLQKLHAPAFDSAWVGPFEQLLGAGYALLGATKHGIYQRNLDRYNPQVQAKVTIHLEALFSESVASDVCTFDDPCRFGDWVSGFYFNSAIQRIVWAGERLLLTCAAVDCRCEKRTTEQSVASDRPRWPEVLSGALSRLDHVQNDDDIYLSKCRAVREQFIVRDEAGKEREYRRDDPLDHSKILAMLRYNVNNRKHRIYIRAQLRDQESAKHGDNQKWFSCGADFQMDLAREAFELVCDAYEELRAWNPRPTLR
jgi:hypothetical protein